MEAVVLFIMTTNLQKTFLIAIGQFIFMAPNVHHIFQKGFIFAQTTSDSLEMISMKRICYEV